MTLPLNYLPYSLLHIRCYSLFYRVTSSSTTHFLQSGMFMRTFFLSLSLHGPLRLAKLQCRPAAARASGGLGRGRARFRPLCHSESYGPLTRGKPKNDERALIVLPCMSPLKSSSLVVFFLLRNPIERAPIAGMGAYTCVGGNLVGGIPGGIPGLAGLGAGCDGGSGTSKTLPPLRLLMVGRAVEVWGVAVIMSSAMVTTEAGLLGWLPATMGYVGRSSGPCDCLLRISNV